MAVEVPENAIIWLHLSDLHLKDAESAETYRTQLETDLRSELKVPRLDYLVISGDIGDYALEAEYAAATGFVRGLMDRYELTPDRLVIVPGNHDLNWDKSEAAYQFVPKRQVPAPLSPEYIPAGEAGAVKRDETKYRERFAPFGEHFYRPVSGREYPLDYPDQIAWVEHPERRLLFVGFNSAWQIDHHYKSRAGIKPAALSKVADRLNQGKYGGWLKIAVWHHPVTGPEAMDSAFLEQLVTHGFQLCMHGHIHEAQDNYFKYDSRGLHIVGAGTFGAPAKDQVPGIPLQYNLLIFDPGRSVVTVHTRKKEKPAGAWSADARWGDRNAPRPSYELQIRGFNQSKEEESAYHVRKCRARDSEFREGLLRNIRSILEQHSLLSQAIRKRVDKEELSADQDLAQYLSDPGNTARVVQEVLRPALKDCCEAQNHNLAVKPDQGLCKAARELLENLLLFIVDPNAIAEWETREALSIEDFQVAIETAVGLEIVSARFRQMKPGMASQEGKFDVRVDDAITTRPIALLGHDEEEQMAHLYLDIWNRVCPGETRSTLSPGDKRKLKASLMYCEKYKDRHLYIPVPEDFDTPLRRREFYERFQKDAPVVVFFMTTAGQRVLLVDDECYFATAVHGLLKYLDKHCPKDPSPA